MDTTTENLISQPANLPRYCADMAKTSPGVMLLMERILEIQCKGKRYAWIDFSGHTDWIIVRVSKNRECYKNIQYEKTVYLPGGLKGSVTLEDFNKLVAKVLWDLADYV